MPTGMDENLLSFVCGRMYIYIRYLTPKKIHKISSDNFSFSELSSAYFYTSILLAVQYNIKYHYHSISETVGDTTKV